MTAIEAMKIICSKTPVTLFEKFKISPQSKRCLLPKFSLSKVKSSSFIFNSSKILNYFAQHDIKYNSLLLTAFKKRLKNHLLFTQSFSVEGDSSWLPCNHDIFSDIKIFENLK